DAIAAHDRILFRSVAGDEAQIEIPPVFLAKVEDVADLGRASEGESSLPTGRTYRSRRRFGDLDVDAEITRIAIQDVVLTSIGEHHELVGKFLREGSARRLGHFRHQAKAIVDAEIGILHDGVKAKIG